MHKYQETHLFEDTAVVKSITENNGFLLAELAETIFYPGGGGQPCDFGVIKSDKFVGNVVEVSKEDGKIIHKIKPVKGILKENDKVTMIVNKERRIKLARMHTGEHILFKSIQIYVPDASVVKVDLDQIESSLFINSPDLNWEILFKAEKLANQIISEKRAVIKHILTKEEAGNMKQLRIKNDRIKDEKVRVIEVKDFDWSACAGTHASDSKYVGSILITKFSLNKGNWEIRFKVDIEEDIFNMARIARESSSLLATDINNVPESITRLQKESEDYKEKFRRISSRLLDFNYQEKIDGMDFIYNIVDDVEKKQLTDKAASLLKEKTIVCFVNKAEGKATILLSISLGLKLNAPEILNKVLVKFNGRGGGRDSFAMGSVEEKYAEEVLKEIREIVAKSN